jgi:peptidoglycan-associated lipoprotein
MQPRFAALLFVLGLADLAYVNLGLGHEVFGDAASGAANPADGPEPRASEAARAPSPPPAPAEAVRAAPSVEQEPSAATPDTPPADTPTPSAAAPAVTPSAPPSAPEAPRSEATALPEPAPQVEPHGEPVPGAPPAPRPETPGEPAPSVEAVAGSPRPAQAGVEAAEPVASAAGLPDAALTVAFPDTASAGLSEEAQAELQQLAAKLRAHPDYRIHIVGHADARGSREFNLDLGGRRARAVTELLARAGVPREQLEVESRGEDQPRVYGNSEQTWAANRRVEISIGMERNTTP